LDAEIIVVDNNSSDDSCNMVRDRFADVVLIENKENVGFAKANNQGVAIAKGEYICILNPDTVVSENLFSSILEEISSLDQLGVLGVKLIDGSGGFLPESKRNIPSPLTSLKRLFGIRLAKAKDYYATHIKESDRGNVDVLVGAFLISKRDTYLQVGGFDEDYFMYGEDIDLSYKMKKNGFNNYYLGNYSVIHYKGESTVRNVVYVKRFYGAMRLFYKKHFRSTIFVNLLIFLAIRLLAIAQFFRKPNKEAQKVDQ